AALEPAERGAPSKIPDTPVPVSFGRGLLLADGSSVQINPAVPLWVDVEAFRQGLRPQAGLAEAQAALALYSGDLLEDLYDDWCAEQRAALRRLFLEALERVSRSLYAAGRATEALACAQRWAAAEPLDEAAQRRLWRLHATLGDRSRAVQSYQTLVKTLAVELGTDPLPETRALIEAIQNGSFQPGLPAPDPRAARPRPAPAPQSAVPPAGPTVTVETPLPFVGRGAELARLESALQEARAGAGRLILIVGEAGIGKTRLMQEYLARHAADRPALSLLEATCHELESLSPFAPVRQALQQGWEANPALLPEAAFTPPSPWLAGLAPLLPALARRFPYLPAAGPAGAAGAGGDPWESESGAPVRETLKDLFLSLSQYATPRPLHVILDDLHRADAPTWELLAALARRAPGAPLLLIGLCRLEDLPAEQVRLLRLLERGNLLTLLALQRLTQEQCLALAQRLHPSLPEDPIFLRRLYAETEGNPFFLIETVRTLHETGLSLHTREKGGADWPGGGPAPVPPGVQRMIEARLDRLTDASRELLGPAAAIGRAFTLSLLEEISQAPPAEVVRSIEEWVQRGLASEEARGYNFRHDRIRQIVYAGLSRARREYLHRRVADVLETAIPPADASTLAYHYARSDQPLRALPYLTRAGEQALQMRAYHDARQFGLQAVSLLGQLPGPRQRGERIDLNLQLAQAYSFTGDLSRALDILSEAEYLAASLGDAARMGRVFRHSAQILWLRGRPEAAGDYARRALRAAEEQSDRPLLLAALRMLGRVSVALSAFDDAIAHFLRYINLHGETVEGQAISPGVGGEMQSGPAAAPSGGEMPSRPVAAVARPGERAADLPIVLGYLGVAYARVGAWERALTAARRGLALAEAGAAWETIAFARMQLAFVHADFHDWQACLDVLQSAPEPPEPPEPEALTPPGFMLLSLRGVALGHLGQPAAGVALLRRALEWAEATDHRVFHYLPRLQLAECLGLAGDLPAARAEVERTLRESREAANRLLVGMSLRLLAEILSRQPAPDWARIENNLIESMQALRQIRARPELARTYLALRKLYDRAGQIAWAVDCHFRATTIFEELGMLEELRQAQGQAAGERRGAVVIPDMPLRGPNQPVLTPPITFP
ncbi:MAG: AAA family ATPase, partial [Chloroflexi bacterium]|nr:AAA family ATPase [Chloroflexota bacterium]